MRFLRITPMIISFILINSYTYSYLLKLFIESFFWKRYGYYLVLATYVPPSISLIILAFSLILYIVYGLGIRNINWKYIIVKTFQVLSIPLIILTISLIISITIKEPSNISIALFSIPMYLGIIYTLALVILVFALSILAPSIVTCSTMRKRMCIRKFVWEYKWVLLGYGILGGIAGTWISRIIGLFLIHVIPDLAQPIISINLPIDSYWYEVLATYVNKYIDLIIGVTAMLIYLAIYLHGVSKYISIRSI